MKSARIILLLLLPWEAMAGPVFHEGFENPLGLKNYFLSGLGQWNLAANLVMPPAIPGDSTDWGWAPTFGENVSVARHDHMNETIPGMQMNDVDPTDGVNGTVGGMVKLGSVLGGDYWNSAYPIGVIGEYWLGTGDVRPSRRDPWNFFMDASNSMRKDVADDALTFEAWTKPLPLNSTSSDVRFVSFMIGGLQANNQAGLPSVYVSVEMEPSTINGVPTGCNGTYLQPIPAGTNGVSI
jgi:hypothetical protein